MNLKHVLFYIIINLVFSCAPWKESLKASGNYEVAVNNAIIDYLNTSKINKGFNVFHIFTVFHKDIIGVGINGDTGKWQLGDIKVGDNNKYFPTRFKLVDKKLFYWSDSTVTITHKVINVMKKYNILDTIDYPDYIIPNQTGPYSEGAVDYYFCKTNYLKYKKSKSTISIGYYKFPNLNCDIKK